MYITISSLILAGDTSEIKDGERLPLAVKDMGSCEVYPQTISHNPNGRFVVVSMIIFLCILKKIIRENALQIMNFRYVEMGNTSFTQPWL